MSLSGVDHSHEVYLEIGQKKVFIVAVHWPGWCRSGKDEGSAVRALLGSGDRYSKIARNAGLDFPIPEGSSALRIVHRLDGNATTDFGAPDKSLPNDWEPIGARELDRMKSILAACWLALDEAVKKGKGKVLQKGPRGGGRDLTKIIEHVIGAEEGYLRQVSWKPEAIKDEAIKQRMDRVRAEVLRALEVAADGRLPREGPRGGKRWSARFFVRRLAWHAVDHAWEIEDRITD